MHYNYFNSNAISDRLNKRSINHCIKNVCLTPRFQSCSYIIVITKIVYIWQDVGNADIVRYHYTECILTGLTRSTSNNCWHFSHIQPDNHDMKTIIITIIIKFEFVLSKLNYSYSYMYKNQWIEKSLKNVLNITFHIYIFVKF